MTTGSGRPRALLRFMKPMPRPREPTTIHVEHGGLRVPVVLKRVNTARRFTLKVRAARGDVVLTMPLRGSLRAAASFAAQHARWVAERVGRLPARVPFAPGSLVPFRGTPHLLEARPGLRRRVWVLPDQDPPKLCVSGAPRTFGAAVESYLREEARRDLLHAVTTHAATVKRPVAALTLRDTKSRWGSCTASGRLNFSWRLILAPPAVLDYLAAHEVAHLVHMNHSEAFWAVTRRLAPQIDEAERWLKQHGPSLHGYGA